MYSHILIATDGSDLANKGVEQGLALAKALGAKATVLTATEPFPVIYGRTWNPTPEAAQSFDAANERAANGVFEKVQARADELGVTINIVHVPATPASTAILEKSADLNCDLIVMASHGRTGLNKLILGSQAQIVLSASKVPVLVVR